MPGAPPPPSRQASWKTRGGSVTAAWPVSMRISSLVASALKSPQSTAGYVRPEAAWIVRQISRTWSWRMWEWSNRQWRWVVYTCTWPRGPSTSARRSTRSSSWSGGAGRGTSSVWLIGHRLSTALPKPTSPSSSRLATATCS